eukprot:SAG25_NODE_4055_length_900_cov_1.785268_2_plen_32_part_01
MFVTDWLVGFLDERLLRRGFAELTLRRWFSVV